MAVRLMLLILGAFHLLNGARYAGRAHGLVHGRARRQRLRPPQPSLHRGHRPRLRGERRRTDAGRAHGAEGCRVGRGRRCLAGAPCPPPHLGLVRARLPRDRPSHRFGSFRRGRHRRARRGARMGRATDRKEFSHDQGVSASLRRQAGEELRLRRALSARSDRRFAVRLLQVRPVPDHGETSRRTRRATPIAPRASRRR